MLGNLSARLAGWHRPIGQNNDLFGVGRPTCAATLVAQLLITPTNYAGVKSTLTAVLAKAPEYRTYP